MYLPFTFLTTPIGLLVLGRLQLTVLCCKSGTCDGSTTGSEAVEFVCSLMISKAEFSFVPRGCSANCGLLKLPRTKTDNTKLHFYCFSGRGKGKARRENRRSLSCRHTGQPASFRVSNRFQPWRRKLVVGVKIPLSFR